MSEGITHTEEETVAGDGQYFVWSWKNLPYYWNGVVLYL
jgi:hypothetical protein